MCYPCCKKVKWMWMKNGIWMYNNRMCVAL